MRERDALKARVQEYSELANREQTAANSLAAQLTLLDQANATLSGQNTELEEARMTWERWAKEMERRVSLSGAVVDAARKVRQLVDAQAEDAGLWGPSDRIVEAYIQQELRKLHALVEAIPLDADA